MSQLIEITGTFLHERPNCRWGDTCIADFDTRPADHPRTGFYVPTVAKVHGCDEGELQPHQPYRLYGRWEDTRYGRQFTAKSFVKSQPFTRAGIIRYLQQAPNVGQAIAQKLWECFASNAVRILRESPDVAAAAIGRQLPESKAVEAAKWLEEEKTLECCTIELMELLDGRGFRKNTSKLLVKEFGNRAAELIKADPYLLLRRYPGCGWKKVDAMYLDLGYDPASLRRQSLCAWHAIASDDEGHTWHPLAKASDGIRGGISAADLKPTEALKLAKQDGILSFMRVDRDGNIVNRKSEPGDTVWVAEAKKAANELYIAEAVAAAMAEPSVWQDVAFLETFLSKVSPFRLFETEELLPPDDEYHQRHMLLKALVGVIAILIGSPGTGKTYAAAALIRALIQLYGVDCIAAAAPTSMAAVRLNITLEKYSLPIKATTNHSLLGVDSNNNGEWKFKHDESNPLPYRFLILDEESMKDVDMFAAVMRARPRGCHILLLGDPGQLPPVAHGAPLRDLIAAGIPCGELREIRRNAGDGVFACAAIRDGRPWTTSEVLDPDNGKNLWLDRASTPEQQIAAMLKGIKEAKAAGLDPVWDVQVVAPVNGEPCQVGTDSGSAVSRLKLNAILQAELNKDAEQVPGAPFRLNDKIINTDVNWFIVEKLRMTEEELSAIEVDKDGKTRIANGEQARVIDIQEKFTLAELKCPRRIIRIAHSKKAAEAEEVDSEKSTGTGSSWTLGYAITIHKSQGSDWPVVIVMGDEYSGAKRVFCREAVYTAMSRFKWLCRLVGKKSTFDAFCRNVALNKRKTFLAELLRMKIAERKAEMELHTATEAAHVHSL